MSSNKKVFLTQEGRDKLAEELEYLIKVRRPEIAARIHAAKEEGDITENAGYDEAKHEQGFVEGRIMTVENMLKDAVIIQEGGTGDMVSLGARVTVREEGDSKAETFLIVGSAEVDLDRGWISNESPMGKALLGRAVGDSVSVQTPGGTLRFEIVRIE